jgi:hypothetical protein
MNDGIGSSLGALALFVVITIVIFLVCRELVCWYWKINQNIALLTEIRELLKNQASAAQTSLQPVVSATAPRQSVVPASVPAGPMGTCPNCSATIPISAKDCPKCKASFGEGSTWKVAPR